MELFGLEIWALLSPLRFVSIGDLESVKNAPQIMYDHQLITKTANYLFRTIAVRLRHTLLLQC